MQLDALHAPLGFRMPSHAGWAAQGFAWLASLLERGAEDPVFDAADHIEATRARLIAHL